MKSATSTLPGRRSGKRRSSPALAVIAAALPLPAGLPSYEGRGRTAREMLEKGLSGDDTRLSGDMGILDHITMDRMSLARSTAEASKPGRGILKGLPKLPARFRGSEAGMLGSEAGMATAEYAIATLAAVGLAGLLVVILRSGEVQGFLLNLIRTALSLP
ncbi:DUF4244 domain-containing protein [Paenarthrobacter sp. NPDC089322]|uniref:DUF4244 domain-containing protein n=1 Tax=Paenarthrobacter sp. NPDC089322 TaxID=3155065 RepID=UPI0034164314